MARPKYPSDEVDKLLLRFPPGMRDRIAEIAKANGRSMNSEIIARLGTSLSNDTISKIADIYAKDRIPIKENEPALIDLHSEPGKAFLQAYTDAIMKKLLNHVQDKIADEIRSLKEKSTPPDKPE